MSLFSLRLEVLSAFFPSSSQGVKRSFVFQEAYGISQRGIEVHVLKAFDGQELTIGNLHIHALDEVVDARSLFFTTKHISAFPLNSILVGLRRLYFLSLYGRKAASLVRNDDIDLIHAHFAYPEGFAGLLAKREERKPLVVTLHGYDILADLSVGYGVRLNSGFDAIIRKVLKKADAVTVASRAMYDEAVRAGCDPKKLVLVPNGVDLMWFNPNINGSCVRNKFSIGDRQIIFTLRHHLPWYGIEYLIKAARIVLKKTPDAVFMIGGGGPLRQAHEKLAQEIGVAKNVIFLGEIPHDDVLKYYAASNIFVIPSLAEAFGMVAVEAMASGKPVVGSNVGGIPDIVGDGINGFLVSPRDPRALAEKIIVLLEHPELAKKMGSRGRRIAEEKFDIKKRIDEITRLYLWLVQ